MTISKTLFAVAVSYIAGAFVVTSDVHAVTGPPTSDKAPQGGAVYQPLVEVKNIDKKKVMHVIFMKGDAACLGSFRNQPAKNNLKFIPLNESKKTKAISPPKFLIEGNSRMMCKYLGIKYKFEPGQSVKMPARVQVHVKYDPNDTMRYQHLNYSILREDKKAKLWVKYKANNASWGKCKSGNDGSKVEISKPYIGRVVCKAK